jgi:TRAP-type C4-dicarboxylate transport system permease small subunit
MKLNSAVDWIHRFAAIIAVLSLIAITLMITTNIVLRSAGGVGIRGIIEINEILVAAIAYFAIGVAQWERQHVTITAPTSFLGPIGQSMVTRVGLTLALLYVLIADWEAVLMAAESYAAGEARWGLISVPIWPGRIIVAVGLLMLAVELLRQLLVRDHSQSVAGEENQQTLHPSNRR